MGYEVREYTGVRTPSYRCAGARSAYRSGAVASDVVCYFVGAFAEMIGDVGKDPRSTTLPSLITALMRR